ncbi:hypothetical protein ZWY2020_043199 [Hordeum vulgare]|nr:hypothetical protein ZWY2020_043199 [Hordeum vulgare]
MVKDMNYEDMAQMDFCQVIVETIQAGAIDWQKMKKGEKGNKDHLYGLAQGPVVMYLDSLLLPNTREMNRIAKKMNNSSTPRANYLDEKDLKKIAKEDMKKDGKGRPDDYEFGKTKLVLGLEYEDGVLKEFNEDDSLQQFQATVKGINLPDKKLIMIPHNTASHHSLYVLNKYENRLEILDSLDYKRCINKTWRYQHRSCKELTERMYVLLRRHYGEAALTSHDEPNWGQLAARPRRVNSPKQRDAQCGQFMVQFAKYWNGQSLAKDDDELHYLPCYCRKHVVPLVNQWKQQALEEEGEIKNPVLLTNEDLSYEVNITDETLRSKIHGPGWRKLMSDYDLRQQDMMIMNLDGEGLCIRIDLRFSEYRGGLKAQPKPSVGMVFIYP